jgi:Phage integrase family.
VVTALNTGMRKQEILTVKWDQLDLKHGFILLDRTKNGERREIPINNALRTTLQSIARRLDVPYVFVSPINGKPYQDIKRSFNTACRRACIRDFSFSRFETLFCFSPGYGGSRFNHSEGVTGTQDISYAPKIFPSIPVPQG